MSRRKQAKPRSLKKDDEWDEGEAGEEIEQEEDEMTGDEQEGDMVLQSPSADQDDTSHISEGKEEDWIEEETIETNGDILSGTQPDDVGDDSVDSFESETLGTTPGSSWRSSTPEGGSPESARSATSPASERELSFTLGTTEHTPYQCQFCDKAFPRLSYLKKHEQTHSDQMPFRCDYCSRLFKHKRSRDRHVKLHTGDRKYRCSHCEAAFSRSDHLKIHMKTHDNQKPFQCTVCNRGYNTAAALTSHMQNHKRAAGNRDGYPGSHHGYGRGYRCLQCGERFRRPDLLQAHMSAVHAGEMNAISSPRTGSTPTTPSPRPRSSAHPSLPKLTCMYCTRDSFSTMEQLQAHVHTMHGALLGAELPLLPPPLPQPPHLDQNGLPSAHSPALPYNCESCTMRFPSPSALHQHITSAHSKLSPRSPLTCSICSIPFSSTAGLAEHFLMAHGSPPEQLRPTDLSKKTFERPIKRPRSGEDTLGAGTLLCNQCGAALPDFESFRIHLRAHIEGGTCLTCSTCGARFTDPATLERHTAAHLLSLGAEFGCPSCSRAFSKPDELQKHLMDLHAHHLYRCTICKEIFDSKVTIQVHFAVKHSHECKVYKCTGCTSTSAIFRSEAEFTLHVRAQHLGGQATPAAAAAARCPYCRATCATELELQFHLAAHAEQYRCPLCREGFHVEFLLDRHMQQHHQHQGINGGSPKPKQSPSRLSMKSLTTENNNTKKEATSCDICDRSDFQSENELAAHRKLSHHVKSTGKNGAVSLNCAYCSENCKTRAELENHMKTHSQSGASGGKHKCLICDEVYPSAAVLAEHKLTHCKVLGGNNCTHCKSTIPNEEGFFTHLSQHSNNNNNPPSSPQSPAPLNLPTPCVICRQTLMSDVEARIHARFHLKNSGLSSESYQCALCLKSCSLRDVIPTGAEINNGIPTTYVCKECYRQHSGTTESSEERRCNECHLKFETAAALENHVEEIHRKTYTCIECQAAFESEQEVRAHVQTHIAGTGSLECRLCRRSLGSPLQLQAHLIEHTFAGCGAFTCYLCSAVFTGASGLQQHMLAHGLAARPYDCTRCGLKFFFRAELDNHSYIHLEDDVRIKLSDAVDSLKHPYFLGQNGFHNIESLASCYSAISPSTKKIKTSDSPVLFKTSDSPADFSNILTLQSYKKQKDAEIDNKANEGKTDDAVVKQEVEERDEYIEVSSPIATKKEQEKNDRSVGDLSSAQNHDNTPLLSPKKEAIEA